MYKKIEQKEISGIRLAQFALDRMREAHKKGKGIRLTWKDLDSFSRTLLGEWWCQENPEIHNEQIKLTKTVNQF